MIRSLSQSMISDELVEGVTLSATFKLWRRNIFLHDNFKAPQIRRSEIVLNNGIHQGSTGIFFFNCMTQLSSDTAELNR